MTLEERAKERFGVGLEQLTPFAVDSLRKDQTRDAASNMLKALKLVMGLFGEGSHFYIAKVGSPITNGDQAEIDRAFMAVEAAIKEAEGVQ